MKRVYFLIPKINNHEKSSKSSGGYWKLMNKNGLQTRRHRYWYHTTGQLSARRPFQICGDIMNRTTINIDLVTHTSLGIIIIWDDSDIYLFQLLFCIKITKFIECNVKIYEATCMPFFSICIQLFFFLCFKEEERVLNQPVVWIAYGSIKRPLTIRKKRCSIRID